MRESGGNGARGSLITARWYSDWNHASRCILPGDQFRVYVAIQFVVDIIVADVFQGSAASGAFETLHVKILVLDSHEHTYDEPLAFGTNVLSRW